ncbi:hypothetical protein U1Q18_036400 [Sarracenia purpurea var. burkii]
MDERSPCFCFDYKWINFRSVIGHSKSAMLVVLLGEDEVCTRALMLNLGKMMADPRAFAEGG